MHILSPETDNCPSWINGRERMTVENISWSISTKECCRPRQGWTRDRLVSSWMRHSVDWAVKPQHKQNLLIEWTYFSHTYTNISLGGEQCWLDFGDIDPIFKVTGGLRLLEHGLSASYLLKEWINFNQNCTSILLEHVKELIRFWWHWPHFQGHRRA